MRRPAGDRGETLIELVATIAIMGTAVVALVGATATAIHLSAVHHDQAVAGADVRVFAEAIQSGVAASPTGYTSCAAPAVYRAMVPASYLGDVTEVDVRSGSVWKSTTEPGCVDTGVQRVRLTVRDGDATERLDIVIRRPCRPSDVDTSCA